MENENPQSEPKKEEIVEQPKQKTPEELAWEEQLQKRLEELRKRDPFIYR
jgi:hypothetical protein